MTSAIEENVKCTANENEEKNEKIINCDHRAVDRIKINSLN